MCVLVVWTQDYHTFARGDVADALPDGMSFGRKASVKPEWLFLRVPGMSLLEGRSLVVGEVAGQPMKQRGRPRRRFHKRAFGLDLDALGVGTLPGGRGESGLVTVSLEAVRAARLSKPAPVDDRYGVPGLVVVNPVG